MMQQFYARDAGGPRGAPLVAIALFGLLALSACAPAGRTASAAPAAPPPAVLAARAPVASGAADEATIHIKNYSFDRPSLTVSAGTTVSWLNDDLDVHTATSRTRAFSSPGLDKNETYAFRFDTPGTYAYFCALHPQMTAEIVVE
jgi:plastocyanin